MAIDIHLRITAASREDFSNGINNENKSNRKSRNNKTIHNTYFKNKTRLQRNLKAKKLLNYIRQVLWKKPSFLNRRIGIVSDFG